MKSSSSVWAIILVLSLVAVLVYGIFKAKRAREAHRARSDERAAAMMLAMHQETARARSGPRDTTQPSQAAPASAAPATAATATARANTLQRRPRLLDDNQRLLYLVLRAGLTDHVVMANIRLADLVDADASPAYGERETRLRLLLQERVDCMVCSNELVPLAAVMIYDAAVRVPDDRVKVEALRELGVKYLRFRSDGLPKPAEMRALVLG